METKKKKKKKKKRKKKKRKKKKGIVDGAISHDRRGGVIREEG